MEPVGAGAGGAVSACIIMSGTGVCGNVGGVDEDASWCRPEDQSSGAVEKDDENGDGVDADGDSIAADAVAAAAAAAAAADDDDAVEVTDDVDATDASDNEPVDSDADTNSGSVDASSENLVFVPSLHSAHEKR